MARHPQPKQDEPIRLVQTAKAPRYRVVIDTAPKGQPRRQVTKTFDTLPLARDFVDETRAAIRAQAFTAPSAVTLRALSERWLTTRRDIREVSLNGYASVLETVLLRLGDRPVQSLTRDDIEALVPWMQTTGGQQGNGLSQRSIVYTLGALKQVLAYGVDSKVLPSNVALGVKPPRKKKGDTVAPTIWTPAELLAFRAAADADALAAVWRLSLCGMRRSEVLGLHWSSVDLDAGTVKVEQSRVALKGGRTALDDPKSDASGRVVPVEAMHRGTVELLRQLRTRQREQRLALGAPQAEGLVVVTAASQPVHPDVYSDAFRAVCRSAGVPVIKLHAIRHTLATMMHRSGTAPADAASLLGHSVQTHLSTYVQRTERGAASAAAAFGSALAANG